MDKQELHYKKMTETPVTKLVVTLGIPTTISMLITSVYNMVDTYFVGTLGTSQQGAIGVLFTLQSIIQAFAFMLGHGSGAFVAKELANKDTKKASTYVSTAFFVAVAVGIVFSLLGLTFLQPLMKLLGSTDTILPYAKQYGMCVLLSCPFFMASLVLNNNLRYEGKALFAMIGLGSGGLLNILLDYLFVQVYAFGVLGAGMATAISQVVSFVVLLVLYVFNAQSKISLKLVSKQIGDYFQIFSVGLPSLIRQGLNSISGGLLNNLTKPFGDAAIAAMSIVNRFSSLVMCVGLGIGQGFQPVASFNYQAKQYDRAKKALVVTCTIGFATIWCLAVPTFVWAEQIATVFQKNVEATQIATPALRYAMVGMLFLPLFTPVNMLFQSIRKPVVASFLALLRNGLMFIPILLVATHFWQLLGVQIAQPLADVLTGLVNIPFIVYFFKTTPSTQNNAVQNTQH